MVGREGLTGEWRDETEPEGGRLCVQEWGQDKAPSPSFLRSKTLGNPVSVSGLTRLWVSHQRSPSQGSWCGMGPLCGQPSLGAGRALHSPQRPSQLPMAETGAWLLRLSQLCSAVDSALLLLPRARLPRASLEPVGAGTRRIERPKLLPTYVPWRGVDQWGLKSYSSA